MAYDFEEQDTLDELKATWKRYGNLILGLIFIALLSFSAWAGWQYWQRTQANKATILYDQLRNAWLSKDSAQVIRVAHDIQDKFPRTTYAQLAALNAAKVSVDTNDTKTAKAQLQWALEHGKSGELKLIAQSRLAAVLLDEKDYAGALKLLPEPPPVGFEALFNEKRGDIYFAQQKLSEARASYKLALEKTDPQANEQRQIINLKLDLIGNSNPN